MAKYQQKLNSFGFRLDSVLQHSIENTLKSAQVLLVETRLMNAVTGESSDHAEAIKQIKAQVMTFPKGKIKPLSDLNKSLWTICSHIAKHKEVCSTAKQQLAKRQNIS